MNLLTDRRGSSIGFEYMMTIMVALVLLAGVSTTFDDITNSREELVIEDHMEHAGSEMSAQLNHQYTLLQKSERSSTRISDLGGNDADIFQATVNVDTPERINSKSYTAQVSPSGD